MRINLENLVPETKDRVEGGLFDECYHEDYIERLCSSCGPSERVVGVLILDRNTTEWQKLVADVNNFGNVRSMWIYNNDGGKFDGHFDNFCSSGIMYRRVTIVGNSNKVMMIIDMETGRWRKLRFPCGTVVLISRMGT